MDDLLLAEDYVWLFKIQQYPDTFSVGKASPGIL